MDDYRSENRTWWDELVPHHVASPFYKADAFRRGENVLDPIARERLTGVERKRLLHLQCHFGLDTLAIARMGAEVTGLDFSPAAIAAARALASETGLNAKLRRSRRAGAPERSLRLRCRVRVMGRNQLDCRSRCMDAHRGPSAETRRTPAADRRPPGDVLHGRPRRRWPTNSSLSLRLQRADHRERAGPRQLRRAGCLAESIPHDLLCTQPECYFQRRD